MKQGLSTALLGWTVFCCLFAGSAQATTLSAYDRISVSVVNGEEFSSARNGNDDGFLVGADGKVFISKIGPISVAGRSEADVQQELAERLGEYIRVPEVAVRLVAAGSITVEVSGAVYRPGPVTMSADGSTVAAKDASSLRTVFNAIKQAGGIRPDANIADIRLERAGDSQLMTLDRDAPVIAGDHIVVANLPAGNPSVNMPTQLAPAQITVFVSGSDVPSTNLGQVQVKPGTSVSGALTAAGLTGNSLTRNGRQVALIRRDPANGKRDVQTLAIEKVVSGETDPLLWDGDTIAINSSPAQDANGFLGILGNLLNPLGAVLRAFTRY